MRCVTKRRSFVLLAGSEISAISSDKRSRITIKVSEQEFLRAERLVDI